MSYVRRLEVNNAYTENDTLIIRDSPNGSSTTNGILRIAGPFENGIIDTVWDVEYGNNVHFNITPEYSAQYKFASPSNLDWSEASFPVTDFCTDKLYELVFKIK